MTITLGVPYPCTGPAGTLATFTAVKEPTSASAFHLTGSTGNYVLTRYTDLNTGYSFSAPGFDHNGRPTVTCGLVSPLTSDIWLVTGFFTPVG